jgi:hypothetical protein
VIVAASKQEIILASDSRAIFEGGSHDDKNYCKITALSPKFIFAVTGIVADQSVQLPEPLRFDARIAAEAATSWYKVIPKVRPDEGDVTLIAQAWAWYMTSQFLRGAQYRFSEWVGNPKRKLTYVIRGIFAGEEADGNLSVAVASVRFLIDESNSIVPLFSPEIDLDVPGNSTFIEAFGRTAVFENYMREHVEKCTRNKKDIKIRRAIFGSPDRFDQTIPQKLVRLTEKLDTSRQTPTGPKIVGGRIDVVRIKSGEGVVWFSRKPSCGDFSAAPAN